MSNEQPEECNCCGFETEALTHYHDRFEGGGWYCELCAGTMASRAHASPTAFQPGMGTILKAVCYVGNSLLAEIRKLKATP